MKAVLFDLDGTLTDPREGITRSIAYALERLGLQPPPLDQLTFAIGPPLRDSLAKLLAGGSPLGDRNPTPADVERALAIYRERFGDVGLFENRPYDGIGEALSAIAQTGTQLYVATSKPFVYAKRIVDHFGLDAHFVAVHGCELDGTRELKRELLAHLLAKHSLDPGETVMVGDRGVDMDAARHHGLTGIGALWGYGSREELDDAGAHVLCESPALLPTLVG